LFREDLDDVFLTQYPSFYSLEHPDFLLDYENKFQKSNNSVAKAKN